jgi:hypothetical protein
MHCWLVKVPEEDEVYVSRCKLGHLSMKKARETSVDVSWGQFSMWISLICQCSTNQACHEQRLHPLVTSAKWAYMDGLFSRESRLNVAKGHPRVPDQLDLRTGWGVGQTMQVLAGEGMQEGLQSPGAEPDGTCS